MVYSTAEKLVCVCFDRLLDFCMAFFCYAVMGCGIDVLMLFLYLDTAIVNAE